MSDNYQRIICLVNNIYKQPKKNDFFMFNEGKQFIVDGKRLKLLPNKYSYLPQKDDFYLCIDPLGKNIFFYAYDLTYEVGGTEPTRIKEEEGEIPWDDLESHIYTFLVSNSYQLTTCISPHTYSPPSSQPTRFPDYGTHNRDDNWEAYGYSGHTHNHHSDYHGEFSYGTDKYKEKEAFYDKLYAFVKNNQTAFATDFVKESIEQMEKDGKTDIVNHILGNITFDKLDVPVMLEMLSATQANEEKLKDRKEFFEKVQKHINRIKPNKTATLLQSLTKKEQA